MTKKKLTGRCEASTGWQEDASGNPVIIMCREPARYYKGQGPFGFGLYLCDAHQGMQH